MYQEISGGVGAVYRLTYHYSPRPGVFDNPINVSWEGINVDSLNSDGSGNGDTVWSEKTHLVQATSPTSRLEFIDPRDPSSGISVGGYIDDVIVEPLNTPALLCDLVKDLVSQRGIATSLCAKLNAIAAAVARGNLQAKQGAVGAFINEVNAQTNKFITSSDAALLIGAANNL